jgi:hypothetical protein
MVVWRMANKDVLKFDAIFAMKAVEFLNYALLYTRYFGSPNAKRQRRMEGAGRTLFAWLDIYQHGV